MRFAVEVAQAVRTVWPQHKPIAMRLSCSDWVGTFAPPAPLPGDKQLFH
jgi:2,4-dienoyl-CoA reductase-like NADH-dependent reductase (Old Yellow Enzyme family)